MKKICPRKGGLEKEKSVDELGTQLTESIITLNLKVSGRQILPHIILMEKREKIVHIKSCGGITNQ